LPVVRNGVVQAPTAPGLGTALRPEVKAGGGTIVRESRA